MLIALLVIGIFAIGTWDYFHKQSEIVQQINGKLQIHFLDVGQGDAALLILPTGERVMIDTGTEESGESILSHFAKWKVDYIDYVILSHTHSDHAGGFSLMEEYIGVGSVLYSGTAPDNCNSHLQELFAGDAFSIGDLQFLVLGPLGEEDNENRSLIIRVDYGETSLLFTGDAEKAEEELLLTACGNLLDTDLLKVAHHGSNTSTTMGFIDAVTPEYAVISVSEDNSYGHPSPSVVDRLAEKKCKVYSTHRDGTIVFLSDGKQLTRYRPK